MGIAFLAGPETRGQHHPAAFAQMLGCEEGDAQSWCYQISAQAFDLTHHLTTANVKGGQSQGDAREGGEAPRWRGGGRHAEAFRRGLNRPQ